MSTANQGSERGFALIAVLGVLAVLSLIAVGMLASQRVQSQLTGNAVQEAVDDGIAETAVGRAVLAITDSRVDHRWRVDGVPYRIDIDGKSVAVAVEDELGKVDINAANEATLLNLFRSVGLDESSATGLVDKILDWREPGDTKRLNGAKASDYADRGYGYHPRGGPFQSVEELRLVMGMSSETFDKVHPAITVYTHKQFIDPEVAPLEALLSLAGMDEATARSIVASRTENDAVDGRRAGVIDPSVSLAGRAFSIAVSIPNRQGVLMARTTVIRITGDSREPYWTLYWSEVQ